MKRELYIEMIINGVAAAIPETIKVTDNDLSKSLTRHQSRSETKHEVINNYFEFTIQILYSEFKKQTLTKS